MPDFREQFPAFSQRHARAKDKRRPGQRAQKGIEEKLLHILEAHYSENKSNPKKKSGFAARLQAMQQEQIEMQKKREDLANKKRDLNKK